MATRQKPARTRAAGGRQTSQQQTKKNLMTSDTGYDSSRNTVQFRRDRVDDDSRKELARYITETIKDADTLTELGMVASPTASQNPTPQYGEDSRDLSLLLHDDKVSRHSQRETSPVPTSQRHFSEVNLLSPPTHSSRTK